jgi:hypothetical protein
MGPYATNTFVRIAARNLQLLYEQKLPPERIVRNAIKGGSLKLRQASELYILGHPEIHSKAVDLLGHFLQSGLHFLDRRSKVYSRGRYRIQRSITRITFPERKRAQLVLMAIFNFADYKLKNRINILLHNAPPTKEVEKLDFQLN